MTKEQDNAIEEKLDTMIELLQQLVALELLRRGGTRQAIAKNLKLAKATVVKMLFPIKKEAGDD